MRLFLFTFLLASFSMADYPIGKELGGAISNGYSSVELKHIVVKDLKSGKYRYEYRIENSGKHTIQVNWQVLDEVVLDKTPFLMVLKPGEIYTAGFDHNDPPKEISSKISVFEKDLDLRNWILGRNKNNSALSSNQEKNGVWVRGLAAQQPAPVPAGLIKN